MLSDKKNTMTTGVKLRETRGQYFSDLLYELICGSLNYTVAVPRNGFSPDMNSVCYYNCRIQRKMHAIYP